MALKPGNLTASTNPNDPAFLNSMASEIENQLNTLMTNDGLPKLSMDPSNRSVRDRRRLFVAIARGGGPASSRQPRRLCHKDQQRQHHRESRPHRDKLNDGCDEAILGFSARLR